MAYKGIPGCERMARNLMDVHGLSDWSFRWSNAKREAGSCNSKRRVISLSRPIAELWGPEGMRDTVLHEIAHALAGHKAGHGREWRAVCRQIGAKPERCYTAGESTPLPPAKYTGTCPNGHTLYRQRLNPKARPQSCGLCSRRFDRRYLITWTDNT